MELINVNNNADPRRVVFASRRYEYDGGVVVIVDVICCIRISTSSSFSSLLGKQMTTTELLSSKPCSLVSSKHDRILFKVLAGVCLAWWYKQRA